MLHDLITVRNKNQPVSSNNLDTVQFDYHFWTDIEKIAKKQREKALTVVKQASKDPDKVGVILRGGLYKTEHVQTKPRRTFDKDVFIDIIIKTFPDISRWQLVELATKSVVDGSVSHSYIVKGVDEDV